MTDREKVIDDIDRCISHFPDACRDCSHFDPTKDDCIHCMEELLGEALELLKEQEPRVLTWDEVKRVEVCWTEQRGYEPYAELYAADWNPKCYGKTIRCWSAKPTKKQQEAVKWDDE